MQLRTIALLAVLSALTLSGCEFFNPTTRSPTSGEPVTAEQLEAQRIASEAKAKAQADAEAAKARAELSRVQRDAERAVAKAQSLTEQTISDIRYEAQARAEDVQVAYAASAAALQAGLEQMRADFAAARADIDAKSSFATDVAQFAQGAIQSPVVQTAAGGIPGGALGLGLLTLLLGHGIGKRSGKAEEQQNQVKADASWDQSQLMTLLHSLAGANLAPTPATKQEAA